jgi:hypothetical protein
MENASVEQQLAAPSGPIRGQATGLAGVKGRLLVTVGDQPLGVLQIDDGALELAPGPGPADASVAFNDRADVVHLLKGELNPVVAVLQDRLRVGGNAALATQVILGMRAGSSFKGERLAQEG